MTYKEGTLPMDDAPTGKVYADIIEAILGLVFLECDFEMAMKVRFLFAPTTIVCREG